MFNRTGIILAGGKSRRMNFVDKGLIDIHGKNVIQYVIDSLLPIVDQIIIISNNTEYFKFGYSLYSDIYPEFGPMSGIYSGLYYSKSDSNIVSACDLPMLKTDFFEMVINHSQTYDAVVPRSDGYTHVLTALYNKRSVLPVLKAAIEKNEHKIRNVLSSLDTQYIDLENKKYSEMLVNMNTEDELEIIKRRLS